MTSALGCRCPGSRSPRCRQDGEPESALTDLRRPSRLIRTPRPLSRKMAYGARLGRGGGSADAQGIRSARELGLGPGRANAALPPSGFQQHARLQRYGASHGPRLDPLVKAVYSSHRAIEPMDWWRAPASVVACARVVLRHPPFALADWRTELSVGWRPNSRRPRIHGRVRDRMLHEMRPQLQPPQPPRPLRSRKQRREGEPP